MPRRRKPLPIIYEYAAQTDVERCARALVRLLLWEPPAPGTPAVPPTAAQDRDATGEAPASAPVSEPWAGAEAPALEVPGADQADPPTEENSP